MGRSVPTIRPSIDSGRTPGTQSPIGRILADPARWDGKLRWGLRSRAWLWVPLLLYVPTLGGSFMLDDLYMIRRIERFQAGEISEPALFRFFQTERDLREQRDRTSFVWWVGGGERTAFFRPLAELALRLDYAVFGRRPLAHRLVSLGWFVLAVWLVRRLYLAADDNRPLANLATAFFGVAQTVSLPATFVSDRSDLMVVVGVVAATLAMFAALRKPGSGADRLVWLTLAMLGYAFALGAKEAAAPLAAVWAAYAWIEQRCRAAAGGAEAASIQALRQGRTRWMFAVCAAVLVACYLAYYAAMGYGVRRVGPAGDVGLLDSLLAAVRSPSDVAALGGGLLRNLGLLLTIWTIGVPGGLLLLFNLRILAWVVCGAAVLAGGLLTAAARPHWRESSAFRLFALWMLLFSVPPLLATPEPRLLCAAQVGWSYCLACIVCAIPRGVGRIGPWLVREQLLLANVGLAAAFGLGAALATERIERQCQDNVRSYLAELPRPLRDGDALVVTQPQNRLELFAPGPRLEFVSGRRDVRLHYLTVDPLLAQHVWRRIDDARTLTVGVEGGGLFGNLVGPEKADDGSPVAVGTVFRNRDFTATVTKMEQAGVSEIRVRFERPMTSDGLFLIPPTETQEKPKSQNAKIGE